MPLKIATTQKTSTRLWTNLSREIPLSYPQLIWLAWNDPETLRKLIHGSTWNRKFNIRKDQYYKIFFCQDFLDHPEKYTIEWRLSHESNKEQLKLDL